MAGPSGIITQRYAYTPFGRVLEAEGEESNALGYTGEHWDADAGLLYLRARWYDPSTGRFLTKDPFPGYPTLPQSQHPYTCCHNNPIDYTDPNGEILLFVLPLTITLPLLVGGTAWAIDWWLQVRHNMDKRCMSFWKAVYHENLNWNEMANVGLSPTPGCWRRSACLTLPGVPETGHLSVQCSRWHRSTPPGGRHALNSRAIPSEYTLKRMR